MALRALAVFDAFTGSSDLRAGFRFPAPPLPLPWRDALAKPGVPS